MVGFGDESRREDELGAQEAPLHQREIADEARIRINLDDAERATGSAGGGSALPPREYDFFVDGKPYTTELPKLVELASDLATRAVNLRSLTDGIDTSGPAGRLVFQILASIAEMERELIRERTIAELAARRGKDGGGGGHKPVLTPRKMEQARKLLDAGERPRDVAELIGVSLATLYRQFPASERVSNRSGGGAFPRHRLADGLWISAEPGPPSNYSQVTAVRSESVRCRGPDRRRQGPRPRSSFPTSINALCLEKPGYRLRAYPNLALGSRGRNRV